MLNETVSTLKSTFVDRLDYTLAYTALTILLFFYGFSVIKGVVRSFRGTKPQKFIIFSILVLFGLNIFLAFVLNFILSISDAWLKWVVILGLVLFSFIKFDIETLKK